MKLLDILSGRKSEDTAEHRINPVYDTARSCLVNLSRAECPEALLLNEKFRFTDNVEAKNAINKGVAIFQEIRYRFINSCIEKSGCKNVLDVGCGYSPRGILLSGKGYRYIGADLSAVVKDMSVTVSSCLSGNEEFSPKYIVVDATDPEALCSAADELTGPVCMVTEGMLMYFPIYELKEYIKGIKAVLGEHGGCLLTPDFCMNRLLTVSSAATTGKTIGKLLQKSAGKVVSEYTYGTENAMDPSVWYVREDDEKPYGFFTGCGFKIERIPVYDGSMELRSLAGLKEKKRTELIEELKNTYGWKMTCSEL